MPDTAELLSQEELEGLINGWCGRVRALSRHLELAIAAALHRRNRALPPLQDTEPVPGCGCASCITVFLGGGTADARFAEDVVHWLADLPASAREGAVSALLKEREASGYHTVLPGPRVLTQLAAALPGALRTERDGAWRRGRSHFDLARVRSLPIAEVARTLGLKLNASHRALCPFHDDRTPSLHFSSSKNRAFCNPCGRSWDSIALVMELDDIGFKDAVNRLSA